MEHTITFTVPERMTADVLGETFTSGDGQITRTYTDDEYVSLQNMIVSKNIIILSDVVAHEESIRIRNTGVVHRTAVTVADKVSTIDITVTDQPATVGTLTAVDL